MIAGIIKGSLKACYAGAVLLFITPISLAQQSGGFAGGVSPARIEVNSDAGNIVRRTLSIYNLGDRPQEFKIQTNDWRYSEEGQISFSEPLLDNSCREWVRLERHTVKVLPSSSRARKFRFEAHVPENAAPQECRFAIIIESLGEPHLTQVGNGAISLPTTGKIGVIVYLAVGGVEPALSVQSFEVRSIKGREVPAVKVVNTGAAHGRIDSEIMGEDRHGVKLRLSVASSPILPGQTRLMPLTPDEIYREKSVNIAYPLKLRGRLFFDNSTYDIDTTLNRNSTPSS